MEPKETEDELKKKQRETFNVDKTKIKQSLLVDNCPQLADLGITAYSQDVFEEGVLEQIDEACYSGEPANSSQNATASNDLKEIDRSAGFSKHQIINETNELIRLGEATPFDVNVNDQIDHAYIKESVAVVRERRKVEDGSSDVEIYQDSDSDYQPSSAEDLDESYCDEPKTKKPRLDLERSRKVKIIGKKSSKYIDDGSDEVYEKRLKLVKKRNLELAADRLEKTGSLDESDDIQLKGGLLIRGHLWDQLYKYQRTGVRWLWELHRQSVGGIMGDEMGLGKTIQIIAFLGSVSYSKLPNEGFSFSGLGATLIVCPATVMHQWIKEFHHWWPLLRVAILHDTGSYTGSKQRLVAKIHATKGILITSYSTMTAERDNLMKYDWHYIILDEGHKIRNPDAQTTLAAKHFRTPHRLILTGTPMQNSLKELWSVFDFVFPGRLGSLPDFIREFGIPITQGGYANANPIQVQTAYKCACVLRETISPYLLRRTKADVKSALNLPNKNEQVLFCRLNDHQRDIYKQYLTSRECESILKGRLEAFVGLITMRKLCNHPDLVTGGPNRLGDLNESDDPSTTFGFWRRSGKMIVVEALLKLWKNQNHRVLLFSQSRQMLNILEKFIKFEQYSYLRLDGSTAIGNRQNLVTRYNEDPSIFCLLLTTRVGGLGLNLTGADRVLIYDPDWNPSTDSQARERAWRIGQTRPVTVYRLLTTGTIEEKIYHRQIFKQFLTNRILKDPKQRRFFKTNDLFELFTLNDGNSSGTETSVLFAGTDSEIKPSAAKTKKKSKKSKKDFNIFDELAKENPPRLKKLNRRNVDETIEEDIDFVPALIDEKIDKETHETNVESSSLVDEKSKKMREIAKKLSQQLVSCKLEEKRKRSSKRHKRDKNNCTLDGVVIPNLSKFSDFKPGTKDDDDVAEELSKEQDDYVLKKLFKKSNVLSALKHDKIVQAGDADYALVEAEASHVAKQAVKALAESRKMCRNAYSGVPTWTGKHGGINAKTPRFGNRTKQNLGQKRASVSQKSNPLFGGTDLLSEGSFRSTDAPMSSSDLLNSIRKRNFSPNSDSDTEAATPSDVVVPSPIMSKSKSLPNLNSVGTRYEGILTELRHFIAFGSKIDGKASTDEILRRFGSRVALQDSAVFKSLLQKICDFTRSTNGDGLWVLKNDFR